MYIQCNIGLTKPILMRGAHRLLRTLRLTFRPTFESHCSSDGLFTNVQGAIYMALMKTSMGHLVTPDFGIGRNWRLIRASSWRSGRVSLSPHTLSYEWVTLLLSHTNIYRRVMLKVNIQKAVLCSAILTGYCTLRSC